MEEIPFSDATSFYETMKEQLNERDLTEHQRELAEYIIGSLDDDGLLRKPLDGLCDELAIYAGIETTPEELEEYLRQAGFREIRQYGDRTLRRPKAGAQRIFFAARKD